MAVNERNRSRILQQPTFPNSLRIPTIFLSLLFVGQIYAQTPEDNAKVATELGRYSIRTGTIIYKALADQKVIPPGAHPYALVAASYQKQITSGQLASDALLATGGLISASFQYGAAIDPEPITRFTALALAKGTEIGINKVSDEVLESSRKSALQVLALAVDNDKTRLEKLDALVDSPDKGALKKELNDLLVGSDILNREIGSDANAIALLEAHFRHSVNRKQDVELLMTQRLANDQKQLASNFKKNADKTKQYFESIKGELDDQKGLLTELNDGMVKVANSISDVRSIAKENQAAIRGLGRIEYMNWTPQQQKAALESGIFPEITPEVRDAEIASLEKQIDTQMTVNELNKVSLRIGQFTKIAENLNIPLPPEVVQAAGFAQTASSAVTQYLSGDIVGAALSASSIFGGGKKADPNAAMMGYLKSEFGKLNARLENIENLQIETLKSIDTMRREQFEYHQVTMKELAKIEYGVNLANDQIRRIQFKEYAGCDTLTTSTYLNGIYPITSREQLIDLLNKKEALSAAISCYQAITDDVSSAVVNGQTITGSLLSDEVNPIVTTQTTQERDGVVKEYKQLQIDYETLISLYKSKDLFSKHPLETLLSLANPVMSSKAWAIKHAQIKTLLETAQMSEVCRAENFETIRPALAALACYEKANGLPNTSRINDLVNAKLIGRRLDYLVQMSDPITSIVQFCSALSADSCIGSSAVENASNPAQLKKIMQKLKSGAGMPLKEQLPQLVELAAIQQSVLYGDESAHLLYSILFDEATHTAYPYPADSDITDSAKVIRGAYAVLNHNAVLSEGVVAIAMYKQLSQDQDFNWYQFQFGYEAAVAPINKALPNATCGNPYRTRTLALLLDNKWQIKYQKPADLDPSVATGYSDCVVSSDHRNEGLVVQLNQLVVRVPLPDVVASGKLSTAPALLHAVSLRQRQHELIVDRTWFKNSTEAQQKAMDNIAPKLIDDISYMTARTAN